MKIERRGKKVKTIKGISITFENCEMSDMLSVGDMEKSDIKTIHIGPITHNIETVACNAVKELFAAENIEISFNNSADRPTFIGDFKAEDSLFNRIKLCPDITWITIYYDDDSFLDIAAPWIGDDMSNYLQSWELNQGIFSISIKR